MHSVTCLLSAIMSKNIRNQKFWVTTDMNGDDLIYPEFPPEANGIDNTH
jgi:hypothetical protein